jgi:hypothetical protein
LLGGFVLCGRSTPCHPPSLYILGVSDAAGSDESLDRFEARQMPALFGIRCCTPRKREKCIRAAVDSFDFALKRAKRRLSRPDAESVQLLPEVADRVH